MKHDPTTGQNKYSGEECLEAIKTSFYIFILFFLIVIIFFQVMDWIGLLFLQPRLEYIHYGSIGFIRN